MTWLRHIRLATYAMVLAIALLMGRRLSVIPVDLTAPAWVTSPRSQMMRAGVLSSLAMADRVTAEIIWSDEDVYDLTSPKISVRSPSVEVNSEQRALVVRMLNLGREYEDFGGPCLCYFQPQLRLRWNSGEKGETFGLLVSGLSHGEIRSYRGDREVGLVRSGTFIPMYLDLMDALFPGHRTSAALRRYHNDVRLKEAGQAGAPSAAPSSTQRPEAATAGHL